MKKLIKFVTLIQAWCIQSISFAIGIDKELKNELDFLPDVSLQNDSATPEDKVFSFAGDILITIMQFAGVIAVLMIVINAAKMLAAAGDDEKIGEAKKGITWALGGLVLLILSYVIIQFVVKLTLFVEDANI